MATHVLEPGHEALIRAMVAPDLPAGWTFLGARVEGEGVRARYAWGAARAEVRLEHPSVGMADKGSVATATMRVHLRASAGAPEAATLFQSVLRSVRAHEHEVPWIPVASEAASTVATFAELAIRGRVREALELAERSVEGPRLALASAQLRAAFHDNENAARDARLALAAPSISDRLAAANVLAATGHGDEALRAASALARDAAGSAAVLLGVAALHSTAGDHAGAIALYERALTIADDRRAHLALAGYCAGRGDSEGARRNAAKALDGVDAHVILGIADALEGAFRDALARFEHAVALAPLDPRPALWRAECLMQLGELERARDEAHRGRDLTEDGTNHVPALILRAAILARLGVEEPIDPVLVEAMAVLSPSEPTNWMRALCTLGGNRGEPTTYLTSDGELRQLALTPSARTASKHALRRFVATASTEEAERDFDRVHASYPGVPEPYNYRGELWLYVGDAARARACFEQALALYPRSRWAFIGLAAVDLLEDRAADALATLARGIELAGGPGPTAYVYRGEAHRRLGDRAAARSDLEYAVQLNPSRVGAWINLALLQAEEHDTEGLAHTMTILRTRAPAFVADAEEVVGADDVDVLREMLAMLRGNRASTCVTYFTRTGILRTVPPYREPR